MFRRITKRHITGGAVAAVILLSLVVILGAWRDSITGNPIPMKTPQEAYQSALVNLDNMENIAYSISATETITTPSARILEIFTQEMIFLERNTADPQMQVSESRKIGDFEIQSTACFADNTEYLTVQNGKFQAAGTAEAFQSRYAPAALIDPALYTEISGYTVKRAATIHFSGASAPENWAVPDGAVLLSAAGSAHLDRSGVLTACTYTLSYELDGTNTTVHYTVDIHDNAPQLSRPESTSFLKVDSIEAPYLAEKACGYLMNATAIQAKYTDHISCEAFGDARTQTVSLKTDHLDSWSAQVDTSVSLSNTSKTDIVTTTTKAERFSGNAYTVSTDGGVYVQNPDVDRQAMQQYCQNLLIGTTLLPEHIATAKLQEVDSLYAITFQATPEFAKLLAEEACTTLYNSPTILEQLIEAAPKETVTCYLNISKETGFPLASGFQYEGTYLISEIPYLLTYKADQTYQIQ